MSLIEITEDQGGCNTRKQIWFQRRGLFVAYSNYMRILRKNRHLTREELGEIISLTKQNLIK